MKKTTNSAEETEKLAMRLGMKLRKGLICLYGELGAGKTTFVRGLAKGLQIKSKIQSPTFTYERIHKGIVSLYHFDFYRISNADALLLEELKEVIARGDGVIAIEWAEKISHALPKKRTDIFISHLSENQRLIRFKP